MCTSIQVYLHISILFKVNQLFLFLFGFPYSDSSSTNDIPGVVDGAAEEEVDSLLKLPKVPFAMDLDVHSNRSSVISQVFIVFIPVIYFLSSSLPS